MFIIGNPFRYINSLLIDNSDLFCSYSFVNSLCQRYCNVFSVRNVLLMDAIFYITNFLTVFDPFLPLFPNFTQSFISICISSRSKDKVPDLMIKLATTTYLHFVIHISEILRVAIEIMQGAGLAM